jgi:hypothetical protein
MRRREGKDGRAARDVVGGKHECLHEAEPESGKRKMIDEAERARRKAAVEYAIGSVRLEGFEPSEFAKELDRRYIAGEITGPEKTATLLAHYGCSDPGTARVSRALPVEHRQERAGRPRSQRANRC